MRDNIFRKQSRRCLHFRSNGIHNFIVFTDNILSVLLYVSKTLSLCSFNFFFTLKLYLLKFIFYFFSSLFRSKNLLFFKLFFILLNEFFNIFLFIFCAVLKISSSIIRSSGRSVTNHSSCDFDVRLPVRKSVTSSFTASPIAPNFQLPL